MRGELEVETLLKIILVLVIVWLALQILGEVFRLVLGPLSNVLGLIIVVLIVLWLLDRL